MSFGDPTFNRRVTMSRFRACSTCRSRSQATLYHCALQTIANRLEVTFERLRYHLGGDRPSQTARLPRFHNRITVEVRAVKFKG
jgi:hypothetical protein